MKTAPWVFMKSQSFVEYWLLRNKLNIPINTIVIHETTYTYYIYKHFYVNDILTENTGTIYLEFD